MTQWWCSGLLIRNKQVRFLSLSLKRIKKNMFTHKEGETGLTICGEEIADGISLSKIDKFVNCPGCLEKMQKKE